MLVYMKKFATFTLISLGASFVLFLFFGNLSPDINSLSPSTRNGKNSLTQLKISHPTSLFDKFTNGASSVLGISSSYTRSTSTASEVDDASNLTDTFAKLIASKMIANNPNGAQRFDGQDSLIMPEGFNLTDPSLKQNFALVRNQIFSPAPIDESKLNIINSTNPEDLKKYFFTIEVEYFRLYENSGYIMDVKSADETLKNFKVLENIFSKYKDLLYSMNVPVVFKTFHIKLIRATLAEIEINKAVVDYESDPLKAVWMEDLQNEVVDMVKKLTLEEASLMKQYNVVIENNKK